MKKKGEIFNLLLLAGSTATSFFGASYLLNKRFVFAVLLIGVYFAGGLWMPQAEPGKRTHAAWLGISLGFGSAVLMFLPSAFAR